MSDGCPTGVPLSHLIWPRPFCLVLTGCASTIGEPRTKLAVSDNIDIGQLTGGGGGGIVLAVSTRSSETLQTWFWRVCTGVASIAAGGCTSSVGVTQRQLIVRSSANARDVCPGTWGVVRPVWERWHRERSVLYSCTIRLVLHARGYCTSSVDESAGQAPNAA